MFFIMGTVFLKKRLWQSIYSFDTAFSIYVNLSKCVQAYLLINFTVLIVFPRDILTK